VGFCGIFEYFPRFEFFLLPSRVHARPHAGNANRWLAEQRANTKPSLNRKVGLEVGSKIQIQFLAVAFFKSAFKSGFSKQVFKFLFFCSTSFLSSAKFQVGFVESLAQPPAGKSASRFSVCVLVNFGFDWLCFTASALFMVGFVGFQNRLFFFSAKSRVN
jgi:hypothetical protein